MVKIKFLFIFLFCLTTQAVMADSASVLVELNKNSLLQQRPIEGTIIVEHDVNAKVDVSSFKQEGKSLTATFIKDASTVPGSPIIRSHYHFEVAPQSEGIHLLAPISVTVANDTYSSPALAYEVMGGGPQSADNRQIILQLENVVDYTEPLYLGQVARFGYRMIFNDNIELKEQQLPLLEAQGFRKIGDQQVADKKESNQASHRVIQVVKPINAGTFTFGPSYITGIAYREVSGGERIYTSAELRADAPALTVVVKGFPIEGKPPSFNGAIGEDLDFRVFLLTLPEMNVGDQMLLSLNVSGKGDLADIPMPDLCCQPGFSGVFKQSDLPPVDSLRGLSRTYVVEMRSLTDKVTEIPPIQFAYFNPKTSKYKVISSNPIPIVVNPAPEGINVPPSTAAEKIEQQVDNQEQQGAVWPNTPTVAPSLEIKTIYDLGPSDLRNLYFGTWWALFLIPLGGLLLYAQHLFFEQRKKQAAIPKIKESTDFFDEAMKEKDNPAQFYHSLNVAFMQRLKEYGYISDAAIGPEELPKIGICGEIREFLCRIEASRFAGQSGLTTDQIGEQARQFFDRIQRHG